MNDSYIGVGKHGATSFVGPDATELFRVATLRSALGLLSKGITPTRGLTITKALALATGVTKKKYKRTEIEKAREDLKKWADEMAAALPKVQQEG
jgi:type II secretory pathway component PulF